MESERRGFGKKVLGCPGVQGFVIHGGLHPDINTNSIRKATQTKQNTEANRTDSISEFAQIRISYTTIIQIYTSIDEL